MTKPDDLRFILQTFFVGDNAEAYETARAVVDSLIPLRPDDDHWARSARGLVVAIIMHERGKDDAPREE
jgi:hypothetical protein